MLKNGVLWSVRKNLNGLLEYLGLRGLPELADVENSALISQLSQTRPQSVTDRNLEDAERRRTNKDTTAVKKKGIEAQRGRGRNL